VPAAGPAYRPPIPLGLLAGTLISVAAALALCACGSSATGASRPGARRGASGSSATQARKTTARSPAAREPSQGRASYRRRCRRVPAPPSHAGERAPKPSQRLNPARAYLVTLATNCGSIVIELDVKQAPLTTASFASLVEHGFYNGLTFHRVVRGYIVQGGDPNGDGTGGPGYTVVEPPPAGLQYTRGIVAMAKTESEPAGSSGSQFFIVTAANTGLPAQYALVGRVSSGERVLDAISEVPTIAGPDGEENRPRRPIVIERATLAEG
jgi:peptidyl-prolyl cis-trans isomerase B (cyclophilin B)